MIDAGAAEVVTGLEADGTRIGVSIAGPALAGVVLPALAPVIASDEWAGRAAGEEPAVMHVSVWDSATAGFPPPPPPWEAGVKTRGGAIAGLNDERLRTVLDTASGILSMADLESGRAVVWLPSHSGVVAFWRVRPLRTVLDWALARPGRHLVHAGAVGVDGRGVLLAGPGKAGKSTTAAACLDGGMQFAGDDYVLVSAGERPVAHPLFGILRLDDRSLAGFPSLAPAFSPPDETGDKWILDIARDRPDGLSGPLELAAVVTPRVGEHEEAGLSPLPASVAAHALATSTIFQSTDGGGEALRLTASVLRAIPAYELRCGDDPTAPPRLLSALLADVA